MDGMDFAEFFTDITQATLAANAAAMGHHHHHAAASAGLHQPASPSSVMGQGGAHGPHATHHAAQFAMHGHNGPMGGTNTGLGWAVQGGGPPSANPYQQHISNMYSAAAAGHNPHHGMYSIVQPGATSAGSSQDSNGNGSSPESNGMHLSRLAGGAGGGGSSVGLQLKSEYNSHAGRHRLTGLGHMGGGGGEEEEEDGTDDDNTQHQQQNQQHATGNSKSKDSSLISADNKRVSQHHSIGGAKRVGPGPHVTSSNSSGVHNPLNLGSGTGYTHPLHNGHSAASHLTSHPSSNSTNPNNNGTTGSNNSSGSSSSGSKVSDKSSIEYRIKRQKNNLAVKRSREKAKQRREILERKVIEMELERNQLKGQILQLEAQVIQLKARLASQ